MAEQRFMIKSAELATAPEGGAGLSVATSLTPVEGGKATVFGLFVMRDTRDDVNATFQRIFSGHLEHAAQTMAGEANIPRRFETMLAELNTALGEAAQEYAPKLTSFEAVVGVLTQGQLFVSGHGQLHALFLHKTAEHRFVIYELNEQFKAETEASWDKPFVTVLDGELHPGDIFYVATRAPSGMIAVNDLQDVLITLPPQGALQRIRQFLSHESAYGALCFHVAEDEPAGPPKKMNPIASLNHLGKTKSDTADLLGEQGTDITGIIKRAATALGSELSAPGSRGYKAMFKRLARATVQILAAVLVAIVEGVRLLWRLARRGVVALLNKRRSGKSGSVDVSHSLKRHVDRLRTLPPASKYIGLGILAVIVVLVISVGLMSQRSAAREDELAFQTAASRIEEKTTAAEASLIYEDTAQAYTLLTEAAVLLETLPKDNRSHTTEIERLQTGLSAILAKIRRLENITPALVAELTDGKTLASFAAASGTLYGMSSDNQLYRINELEHTIENQNVTTGTIGSIAAITGEGANVLLVDTNRQLGRADTTARTLNPITSGTTSMASVEDLTMYNDALYALSASSQQVTKMRAQGGSYEAGTGWISERASDLTGALDLTIDGNVYVLTNTSIVRFKSGREMPWEYETLDPALGEAVDIWTDIDSPYLYILAKNEGGRLIVYNKETGKLVTQYTNPELAQAIGFVVRESDNQIIFSTGTKVWSFSATHLLK